MAHATAHFFWSGALGKLNDIYPLGVGSKGQMSSDFFESIGICNGALTGKDLYFFYFKWPLKTGFTVV